VFLLQTTTADLRIAAMSEEPLFDPSLKKRKKKAVAFIEDPLGADADPTTPAPATIESTTLAGEAVDMGAATAHEVMQQAEVELKKKKKKKEIPLDLVRCAACAGVKSGTDRARRTGRCGRRCCT
jgi:hypothetical protein